MSIRGPGGSTMADPRVVTARRCPAMSVYMAKTELSPASTHCESAPIRRPASMGSWLMFHSPGKPPWIQQWLAVLAEVTGGEAFPQTMQLVNVPLRQEPDWT